MEDFSALNARNFVGDAVAAVEVQQMPRANCNLVLGPEEVASLPDSEELLPLQGCLADDMRQVLGRMMASWPTAAAAMGLEGSAGMEGPQYRGDRALCAAQRFGDAAVRVKDLGGGCEAAVLERDHELPEADVDGIGPPLEGDGHLGAELLGDRLGAEEGGDLPYGGAWHRAGKSGGIKSDHVAAATVLAVMIMKIKFKINKQVPAI